MNSSKTINVLIAEDNFMVSKLIRETVEMLGCTVVGTAINGREAVEMTASLKPDVVLMDIQMPGMDGLEATQRITQACLAPVVILSAYDTPELEKQAACAGAGAFMMKMPDDREIERTIAIAIARFDDMVELRRLNHELSKSQQLAKLGSWELNLETQILTASPEFRLLIDEKPHKVSKHIFEFADKYVLPQDIPLLRERIEYAVKNIENRNYTDNFELCIKIHNETIKHIEFLCSFKSKAIIFGVVQDITEHKQAEKKLARSKAFSDNMINAMPNPVFVKNGRHQWIISRSKTFCQPLKNKRL